MLQNEIDGHQHESDCHAELQELHEMVSNENKTLKQQILKSSGEIERLKKEGDFNKK